jgi:hypothetical protein
MPKTFAKRTDDFHASMRALGNVCAQVYVPAELHARARLQSRKRDVSIREIYRLAMEQFCTEAEQAEAQALRDLFAVEVPS